MRTQTRADMIDPAWSEELNQVPFCQSHYQKTKLEIRNEKQNVIKANQSSNQICNEIFLELYRPSDLVRCVSLHIIQNIITSSHLLGGSKRTAPGLPVEGINVKLPPFPNPGVGLRRFFPRNVIVGVIVLQDFPAGLVNLDAAADFDEGRVGCGLGLGHGARGRGDAAGNASAAHRVGVSVVGVGHRTRRPGRHVRTSRRHVAAGVGVVLGCHCCVLLLGTLRQGLEAIGMEIGMACCCFLSSRSNARMRSSRLDRITYEYCTRLKYYSCRR